MSLVFRFDNYFGNIEARDEQAHSDEIVAQAAEIYFVDGLRQIVSPDIESRVSWDFVSQVWFLVQRVSDNPCIVHRFSMGDPWIIHRLSMDNPWVDKGESMEHPWTTNPGNDPFSLQPAHVGCWSASNEALSEQWLLHFFRFCTLSTTEGFIPKLWFKKYEFQWCREFEQEIAEIRPRRDLLWYHYDFINRSHWFRFHILLQNPITTWWPTWLLMVNV